MRQSRTTLAALMVVLVAVAEICSASRPSSSTEEKNKEEATTARLEIRNDPDHQRHNYREINLPSLSRANQAGGLSVRILNNDEATTKTRVRRWDYSSFNNNDGGWGPKRHSFYDRRPYRVPSDYVFPSDRRRQQQQSRPPNRRNSQVNRFNKPTSRRPFRIYPVFPG
ncbi:hypothetical protein TKK_0004524 [Trichogramma kaykai]